MNVPIDKFKRLQCPRLAIYLDYREERAEEKKNLKKKNSSSKAKIIVSISYEQRITKETPISLELLNALDSTTDYSGLVWGG